MTTREPHDRAPGGPTMWDARTPDATEWELRAKARSLRALAQSALETGTPDGTVREYLTTVMAFAGIDAGE